MSNLKKLRIEKGYGQKEVAAKLGIPVRTYGSYERGERNLSLDVAAKIADVFDVSVDELMNREYTVPVLTLDWTERTLVRLFRNMDERSQEVFMETARRFARADNIETEDKL